MAVPECSLEDLPSSALGLHSSRRNVFPAPPSRDFPFNPRNKNVIASVALAPNYNHLTRWPLWGKQSTLIESAPAPPVPHARMAVPESSLCGQAFAAALPLSRHKKGAIYRDSLLVGFDV